MASPGPKKKAAKIGDSPEHIKSDDEKKDDKAEEKDPPAPADGEQKEP